MMKVVIYKEGNGFVAESDASGSPIVAKGRTKAEAIGTFILSIMVDNVAEISIVGEYQSHESYLQSKLEIVDGSDGIIQELP